MRCPTIIMSLGWFLWVGPAMAALQAPELGSEADLSTFFSDKKPCDADAAAQKKKNPEQGLPAKQPAAPVQVATKEQDKAVVGLMQLGIIPADKQSPEPAKTQIGAQPTLGTCK